MAGLNGKSGGGARFLKRNLNFIIAIICIILFGILYINKMPNRNQVDVIQAEPSSITLTQEIETQESKQLQKEPEISEDESGTTIKIHIIGAVVNPGVYELMAGSRVVDAVEAAGGVKEDADLENVNLAKILQDEGQVKIPKVGEIVDKMEASIQNDRETAADNGTNLININSAEKSELMGLPGIGEVTAGNIIAYREANGEFKNTDEIKKVNRIGEKTFEAIKDLITVGQGGE